MFKSIRFRNFKALHDTILPLGPFTLLVGPNGSGKTTELQAFSALCYFNWDDFPTLARAHGYQAAPASAVEVALIWGPPNVGASLKMRWLTQGRREQTWTDAEGNKLPQNVSNLLSNELSRVRTYAFNPHVMASPV